MAYILVIDDEPAIRDLIRDILEAEGHKVDDAPDGKTGVVLHREHPYDLVITDMVMPEHSGINTINDLVHTDSDVKILAISGGGAIQPERYLTVAEMIGAEAILYKPFTAEDLLNEVAKIIS